MRTLLLALLTTLSLSAFAQDEPAVRADGEKVYKTVDEMPHFQQIEDKQQADKAMLEYVYANVTYPKKAVDNEVDGMTVISFIVEKDGTMSDVQIERGVSPELGAEAYHVVRKMQDSGVVWSPGMEDGVAVRTRFNLPIKFALE